MVCSIFATAWAQSSAVSLQQALDRPLDMTLEDATIADVFTTLTAKTGIRFIVDEQTTACLPYGDQTRVAVRLRNVTLRRDLARMLAPQALVWMIEGDAIRISPSDPLARMCRPASHDELQVLGRLQGQRLTVGGGDIVEQLRQLTGVKELNIVMRVTGDRAAAAAIADKALPCTGAEWLDAFCRDQSWTWYLSNDEIVVLDRKAQIERQLQQHVNLRYQNADIVNVLLDLARQGRFTLSMDPGVMNSLPIEVKTNFSVVMSNVTIAQALEVISGASGLDFPRIEEGVRVIASENLRSSRSGRRTPFFVRITMPGVDGVNLDVYMRADELPQKLVEQIQAQKTRLFELYGEAPEASEPATAEPSQPAAQ